MPQQEFHAQNQDELTRAVDTVLSEISDEVVLALQDAARRAESHVVTQSMEFADEGIFAGAWQVIDDEQGATLENDAPHAAIVEEGSRPHVPPLYPILSYIGRKIGPRVESFPINPNGARWDMSDQLVFKDEPALEKLRRIAVAVARKIGAQGTEPKRILENSQDTFARIVNEELARIS